ncbi:MAG: enoyl-CoA hydratase/isomerase family protein [Euryhalocaulis sp.]|uniref:3-hydroxyacyl-CoA dehydrogenase NAD-binding domain-containing protein n=1 Tax=Euryhalocaulis sp. TaxID=2744307 RepID=UPI0017F4F414|nr:3-hydroxyacyl-CoA dehydrogenase NAD-binding domain-containing protein [Euryhalocaulis sp.]MBA4801861.1 enoyl-CoA hydratase/isomerase family protein [Euryhalocaulis sp.]
MNNFTIDIDNDGIALVTFDVPGRSMNTLTNEVIGEIDELAEKIASDDAIKGAVITSGKASGFCAGADLGEMGGGLFGGSGAAKSEDELKQEIFDSAFRLNKTLRGLETCGKPIAAAINGLALGGGFEITLACHYRVAANDNPKLKVGLPEAMVGVLPGGGGTQRLPRLVGAMNAFDLMLQGKQIRVEKAAELGLVDTAPGDQIVQKAKDWVKANPEAKAPWDQDKFKIPGGGPYHPSGAQVFMGAASMLRKNTWGNYPAQRFILSCVYEGLQLDIDSGLRIESRYFAKLLMRPESRNMIRSIFLSKQALEKGAARPAGQESKKIKKIGVVGAGFMGAGVANVSAQAGIEVILIDKDQDGADRGYQHIEKDLAKRVERKKMTEEKKAEILGRVTATTDYSGLKDADIVVEAVFEARDVKEPVIKKIYESVGPDTIVGSNTSTLPISSLAEYGADQDRFIGVHFFSPVEKMMLVELIKGDKTGDKAISVAIDFVAQIKKTPIVVEDTRGFYANRCVMRYIQQGMHMLEEGYLPALIENGSKMAGMPVGPLSLQDEVAIDLGYKVLQATKKDMGPEAADGPTERILTVMYEADRMGRKNGKGFYIYPEGGKKRLWEELDQFAKDGVLPEKKQPSTDLIRDRVLYSQAIEAARCMEEGIVDDPREADVGSILGWGYAPFTGGVLSFIDTVGTEAFVKRADELEAKYGDPFEVPELLREMAGKGETFYGRFGRDEKKAA